MAFEQLAYRNRVSFSTGLARLCDREKPGTTATAAYGPLLPVGVRQLSGVLLTVSSVARQPSLTLSCPSGDRWK